MRSIIISIIIVLCYMQIVESAYGNDYPVDDKTKIIQIGVGYKLHGMYSDVQVPPLHIAFDYLARVAPKVPLTFGGIFTYARSIHHDFTTGYYNYFAFGFRCAYHFHELVKLKNTDLYAGILVGGVGVDGHASGIKFAGKKIFVWNNPHGSGYFLFGIYGGVHYFFTKHFGMFCELGYGLGYITGGFCFKF